jgi:CRP-like cAMP-binding protein
MHSLKTDSSLRKIGEYLACPPPDIEWALSIQAMEWASGSEKRIGEILVEGHHVTQETLGKALKLQLIDRLSQSSLLKNLSREKLLQIGERIDQVALEPGEILFKEGNRGNSLYVMVKGRLLLSHMEGLDEYPAGAAIPGDVLGEEECFSDGTRDCTAYATERSELLKIRYSLVPRHERKEDSTADPVFAKYLIQRARAALRSDRVYLFVRDQETGELTAQIDIGEESRLFRVMAGSGIVGWVAQRQEIVNLQEAYLDQRFDPALDIHTGYWTRTLLAAPILDDRGEVLGVLEAVNKHAGWFDSDEEALLRAFAKQCAAALQSGNIPPCQTARG